MKSLKGLVVRGCLPAALAAALLAAAPGTASAQVTVGFVETSGTVAENASPGADTPDLLQVKVRVTGLPPADPARAAAITDMLGDITITSSQTAVATASPATLDFSDSDEAVVTVTPMADDNNFKDDTTVLKLASSLGHVDPNPGVFAATVEDDEVAPMLKFVDANGNDKTTLLLSEQSQASVKIGLFPGAAGAAIPAAAVRDITLDTTASVRVSPAGEVTKNECPSAGANFGRYALRFELTDSGDLANGVMALGKALDLYMGADEETLTITACDDGADFRDTTVTVEFEPESLKTNVGTLLAGPPLVITVVSDDEVPEVSFASTRLLVDEGADATVAVLVEGELASEVGAVDLRVSGDARLALQQGGEDLAANADGAYTVDLPGGTSAVLTISAAGEGALADGETRTATITFADTGGAGVGERDAVEVTVRGVTAVPALPLVGQLLLGLLLLAGGARLRRRQG